MGAKDINDPSSIFYKWANSEVELLSEEDIKKKREQDKQDAIYRKKMIHIEAFVHNSKKFEIVDIKNKTVDLSTETRNITHCYYISSIETDEEIIKNLAMNQINSNCKEALFYCACETDRLESIWHTLFDTVFVNFHIKNNVEITEENVLMTSDIRDLFELIDNIKMNALGVEENIDVIYIFYHQG